MWLIVQSHAGIFPKMWPEAQGWRKVVIWWLPDPWQKSEIQWDWQQQPLVPALLFFWFYLNWKGERAWEAASVKDLVTDKVKRAGKYRQLSFHSHNLFKAGARPLLWAGTGSVDCIGCWPWKVGKRFGLTPVPALLQEGMGKESTALHCLIALSTAICSTLLNYG